MNPNNFNLEQVGVAFDTWRSSRDNDNNKSPIPEELWEMVAIIYPHYPRNSICQRLGLSSTQLKRRGYGFEEINSAAPDNTASVIDTPVFLDVAPTEEKSVSSTNNNMAPSIEVIRPDGTTIRLHHLQQAQITHFFQQLLGG